MPKYVCFGHRWGAYGAPTDPLAGVKGPTSKQCREGERRGEGMGKGSKGRGERGKVEGRERVIAVLIFPTSSPGRNTK